MTVAVFMETSGAIRRRLTDMGIDAFSVDLLPSADNSPDHIIGDVFDYMDRPGIDFAVFHPTCTYLTCSAEWAYKDPDFDRYPGVGYHQRVKPETLTGEARRAARVTAISELKVIKNLPYPKVIENPVGKAGVALGKPSQVVQPYQFGDDASKATCLWWLGCQAMTIDPSMRRAGRFVNVGGKTVERWANQTDSGQNRVTPGSDRWAKRSETYPGVAQAMASHIAEFISG